VLHQLSVEDSATTLIQYASGVNAVIDVRWNSRIQRDEFRVVGVDGEIVLNPLNGPALRLTTSDGTVLEENLPAHSNVHFPLVENFASAMLDGHPLACPIDEAIWTDWVTEQVMRDRPC
jgi:predicted dehydrogenase